MALAPTSYEHLNIYNEVALKEPSTAKTIFLVGYL